MTKVLKEIYASPLAAGATAFVKKMLMKGEAEKAAWKFMVEHGLGLSHGVSHGIKLMPAFS